MPNWFEHVFIIDKIKNTLPWTYGLMILMVKKLLEHFMKKKLQKTNQKKFRIEKALKKKGNKLYVKWKSYNNSCNSWIDKKDLV